MGRGWIELAHADEIAPAAVAGTGWPDGATLRVLSQDPESGALTGVLGIPAGFRRPAGHHACASELFVLEGALRVGGVERRFGYYEYQPPGCTQEEWVAEQACELLFMADATPDLRPGPGEGSSLERVQLASAEQPWTDVRIVPGPPPGLATKLLRAPTERCGERVGLAAMVPRWDYPRLEFHDCVEEIYCVKGDLWIGNCGTMRPGSYLWRPEYITHGPAYTEAGGIILVKVPGALINHFVEDPRATPAQNRAQAEREFADGVFARPT